MVDIDKQRVIRWLQASSDKFKNDLEASEKFADELVGALVGPTETNRGDIKTTIN